MPTIDVDLDVPEGVEVRGYERIEEGHAFEVEWDLPETLVCQKCGRNQSVRTEWADKICVIRDLELWEQPAFFVYQPPYHRCGWCCYRQWLLPPFKRKHVTCTYRFEDQVLRLLIGSTEEEVARRLGISAEQVRQIVHYRLKEERTIDPQRVITDVGMDEISLKKRHKLYATILTDLTDPDRPRIMAVSKGRDQAAAEACLGRLSADQRENIRTHRTDMSSAYTAGCRASLPKSQQVVDRFHVAKKLGDIVDRLRKQKTRAYKKSLSPKQRKEFRSHMWLFRKPPEKLNESQQADLEDLFERIPGLERAYYFRWGITDIFELAQDREDAASQLQEYRDCLDPEDEDDQVLLEFFTTYESHQEAILAYFDQRQTSGPVEGLNTKARVITRRCYGIKKTKTLWNRLCLDVNLAAETLWMTVQHVHNIANRIRQVFLGYYT